MYPCTRQDSVRFHEQLTSFVRVHSLLLHMVDIGFNAMNTLCLILWLEVFKSYPTLQNVHISSGTELTPINIYRTLGDCARMHTLSLCSGTTPLKDSHHLVHNEPDEVRQATLQLPETSLRELTLCLSFAHLESRFIEPLVACSPQLRSLVLHLAEQGSLPGLSALVRDHPNLRKFTHSRHRGSDDRTAEMLGACGSVESLTLVCRRFDPARLVAALSAPRSVHHPTSFSMEGLGTALPTLDFAAQAQRCVHLTTLTATVGPAN
ncbi:hypothetical protein CPB97_007225 [Podila verticillata]|nr:hypothetical protein CPB97_007225 [Podila verticillata]